MKRGEGFGERFAPSASPADARCRRLPFFFVTAKKKGNKEETFSIKKRTALRNSLQWGLEQVLGGGTVLPSLHDGEGGPLAVDEVGPRRGRVYIGQVQPMRQPASS